jgi:cytochrome c-type biogenesis protein CcmH/NrfG
LLANSREQMLELRHATMGATPTAAESAPPQADLSPIAAAAPLTQEGWLAAKMETEQKMRALAVEQQLRQVLGTAYNDLGTASAQAREFPLALSYFHDAERWEPKTPGLMRNLGLAAFFSSNYAECVRAMRAAEQLQPLDPTAQSMLALALYSTAKYPEAVKAFEPVGDMVYNDPRMTYSYAFSAVKAGDKQRAAKVLERLRAMNVGANVQVMIGQLYIDMGDRATAQQCFDRAKQMDPSINLPK